MESTLGLEVRIQKKKLIIFTELLLLPKHSYQELRSLINIFELR